MVRGRSGMNGGIRWDRRPVEPTSLAGRMGGWMLDGWVCGWGIYEASRTRETIWKQEWGRKESTKQRFIEILNLSTRCNDTSGREGERERTRKRMREREGMHGRCIT